MPVRTYDPKQVLISVGGIPMSGFADGTFATFERSSDTFSKVSGADGIVSRAKSNDRSGTFTFTLAQTSPANDFLSGFAFLDESKNLGIVPILVKDSAGATLLLSAYGWVKKPPKVEYGKEITNREWVMDCADSDFFIAGNADAQ